LQKEELREVSTLQLLEAPSLPWYFVNQCFYQELESFSWEAGVSESEILERPVRISA
jgi:hypothetical protein